MRTIVTFAFFLSFCLMANSQELNILLVDDSNDFFDNSSIIANGINNNQYDFDRFDAAGANMSPTSFFLSNYDLVIWHTSTQQQDMQFWDIENNQTMDNAALSTYLEQGGNMWLIGNDFLFDRYSDAADTFQLGDFVYDYLGIAQYDAQAYADDDNFGLPIARVVDGQPIPGLTDINWTFPTLWWADAITPRPEAVSIYEMGFDNYVFAGARTGIWYDNGTSKTLSFAFDLAQANNQGLVDNTVRNVIEFFAAQLVDTEELPEAITSFQAYPNPVLDQARIRWTLADAAQVSIELVHMNGQKIATLLASSYLSTGPHELEWQAPAGLPGGMYQLQIRVNGELASKSIILAD